MYLIKVSSCEKRRSKEADSRQYLDYPMWIFKIILVVGMILIDYSNTS